MEKFKLNPFARALLALAVPGIAIAGPEGGNVVGGTAVIARPDEVTTVIDQASHSAVINWQRFSVGSEEFVVFNQPSAASTVLNRVVGNSMSEIFGHMSANGRVFLINPSGVLFGQGAKVDVGALVATSMNLSNEDFLAGRYVFRGGQNMGAVENAGSITAAEGGFVVLGAEEVRNAGLIQARLGDVVLASGSALTLNVDGSGLINFEVTADALSKVAGIRNLGEILAAGGRVAMTAQLARQLAGTAVNNEGLISARGVTEKGGEIYLTASGGDIALSGMLDASGGSGGDGGTIKVESTQDVLLAEGSTVIARGDGLGQGGSAYLVADQTLDVAEQVQLDVRSGDQAASGGGFLEVSGHEHFYLRSDPKVGGTLVIDPVTLDIKDSCGVAPDCVKVSTIEAQIKANAQTFLVAEDQVTLADIADNNLDGRNGGSGGSLLLGIGKVMGGNFVRGSDIDSKIIMNTGDTILVDGSFSAFSGLPINSSFNNIFLGSITAGKDVLLDGHNFVNAVNVTAGGSFTASFLGGAEGARDFGNIVANKLNVLGNQITITSIATVAGGPAQSVNLQSKLFGGINVGSILASGDNVSATAESGDVILGDVTALALNLGSGFGTVQAGTLTIGSGGINITAVEQKDLPPSSSLTKPRPKAGQTLPGIKVGDVTSKGDVSLVVTQTPDSDDNFTVVAGDISTLGKVTVSSQKSMIDVGNITAGGTVNLNAGTSISGGLILDGTSLTATAGVNVFLASITVDQGLTVTAGQDVLVGNLNFSQQQDAVLTATNGSVTLGGGSGGNFLIDAEGFVSVDDDGDPGTLTAANQIDVQSRTAGIGTGDLKANSILLKGDSDTVRATKLQADDFINVESTNADLVLGDVLGRTSGDSPSVLLTAGTGIAVGNVTAVSFTADGGAGDFSAPNIQVDTGVKLTTDGNITIGGVVEGNADPIDGIELISRVSGDVLTSNIIGGNVQISVNSGSVKIDDDGDPGTIEASGFLKVKSFGLAGLNPIGGNFSSGNLTAAGALSVSGNQAGVFKAGQLSGTSVTVGGFEGFEATSIESSTGISIGFAGLIAGPIVITGDVSAQQASDQGIGLSTSADGGISVGGTIAGGNVNIDAFRGSVLIKDVVAAGDLFLASTPFGSITTGKLNANGFINLFTAAGAISTGDIDTTGVVQLTSGETLTTGNIGSNSPTDIIISSPGDIVLGDLSADNIIDIQGGSNITVGKVLVEGARFDVVSTGLGPGGEGDVLIGDITMLKGGSGPVGFAVSFIQAQSGSLTFGDYTVNSEMGVSLFAQAQAGPLKVGNFDVEGQDDVDVFLSGYGVTTGSLDLKANLVGSTIDGANASLFVGASDGEGDPGEDFDLLIGGPVSVTGFGDAFAFAFLIAEDDVTIEGSVTVNDGGATITNGSDVFKTGSAEIQISSGTDAAFGGFPSSVADSEIRIGGSVAAVGPNAFVSLDAGRIGPLDPAGAPIDISALVPPSLQPLVSFNGGVRQSTHGRADVSLNAISQATDPLGVPGMTLGDITVEGPEAFLQIQSPQNRVQVGGIGVNAYGYQVKGENPDNPLFGHPDSVPLVENVVWGEASARIEADTDSPPGTAGESSFGGIAVSGIGRSSLTLLGGQSVTTGVLGVRSTAGALQGLTGLLPATPGGGSGSGSFDSVRHDLSNGKGGAAQDGSSTLVLAATVSGANARISTGSIEVEAPRSASALIATEGDLEIEGNVTVNGSAGPQTQYLAQHTYLFSNAPTNLPNESTFIDGGASGATLASLGDLHIGGDVKISGRGVAVGAAYAGGDLHIDGDVVTEAFEAKTSSTDLRLAQPYDLELGDVAFGLTENGSVTSVNDFFNSAALDAPGSISGEVKLAAARSVHLGARFDALGAVSVDASSGDIDTTLPLIELSKFNDASDELTPTSAASTFNGITGDLLKGKQGITTPEALSLEAEEGSVLLAGAVLKGGSVLARAGDELDLIGSTIAVGKLTLPGEGDLDALLAGIDLNTGIGSLNSPPDQADPARSGNLAAIQDLIPDAAFGNTPGPNAVFVGDEVRFVNADNKVSVLSIEGDWLHFQSDELVFPSAIVNPQNDLLIHLEPLTPDAPLYLLNKLSDLPPGAPANAVIYTEQDHLSRPTGTTYLFGGSEYLGDIVVGPDAVQNEGASDFVFLTKGGEIDPVEVYQNIASTGGGQVVFLNTLSLPPPPPPPVVPPPPPPPVVPPPPPPPPPPVVPPPPPPPPPVVPPPPPPPPPVVPPPPPPPVVPPPPPPPPVVPPPPPPPPPVVPPPPPPPVVPPPPPPPPVVPPPPPPPPVEPPRPPPPPVVVPPPPPPVEPPRPPPPPVVVPPPPPPPVVPPPPPPPVVPPPPPPVVPPPPPPPVVPPPPPPPPPPVVPPPPPPPVVIPPPPPPPVIPPPPPVVPPPPAVPPPPPQMVDVVQPIQALTVPKDLVVTDLQSEPLIRRQTGVPPRTCQ